MKPVPPVMRAVRRRCGLLAIIRRALRQLHPGLLGQTLDAVALAFERLAQVPRLPIAALAQLLDGIRGQLRAARRELGQAPISQCQAFVRQV